MSTVSCSIYLDIPRDEAWQYLSDLSVPQNYVPGVTRTEITTEKTQGEGVSRLVFMAGFFPMRETVTEWREGEGFTIALALKNSPMPAPVKAGSFSYQLSDEGTGTRITNSLSTEFYWRPLDITLGLLSRPIIQIYLWVITRNMRAYYLSK